MILETVRVWVDALQHDTLGVNAQLPNVPTDSADSTPPNISWVKDVTRDRDAFEGRTPRTDKPGFVVGPSGEAARVDGVASQDVRDAEGVGVATEYVSGLKDPAKALRHALYTQRALLRTLHDWTNDSDDTIRKRHDVLVIHAERVRMGQITLDDDSGKLILPSVIEFRVRDTSP